MAGSRAVVRRAVRGDADRIAALANALDIDQGGEGGIYDPAVVLRDGFGPDAPVRFVVAEIDGIVDGYAMISDFYDSDLAARGLFLHDLYVTPEAQGDGLGKRLMAFAAADGVRRGARTLWLGVYTANTAARTFYAGLGARDEEARILQIDGTGLSALARCADAQGSG